VAAFLTLMMRLRQRHLEEHPHWPEYSETPPICTPGQRPPDRTERVLLKPSLWGLRSTVFLVGEDGSLSKSHTSLAARTDGGAPI
jgi:hypothetical protein